MENIGLNGNSIDVLRSIYIDILCCVRLECSLLFHTFQTYQGLRQGRHLSALLFLLYINDFNKRMEKVNYMTPCFQGKEMKNLIFADDLVIMPEAAGSMRRHLKGF